MPTQASPPPALFATVQVAATQAGKPVIKITDFKGTPFRAQVSFPPISVEAARANFLSLAAPIRAAELGDPDRPQPRFISVSVALAAGFQAAGFSSSASAVPIPRVFPAGDAEFRSRIALLESGREPGMGYGARNAASGALGRYQLLSVALRDIGWKDAQGAWTAEAARQGAADEAQFLGNADAQEAAMDRYLGRKTAQLWANGAMAVAGAVLTGTDGRAVPVTEAGLVAAAHRQGASSVARWVEHCRRTPDLALPGPLQTAFTNVEQRLRDFADVPYVLPTLGVADLEQSRPSG